MLVRAGAESGSIGLMQETAGLWAGGARARDACAH